MENEIFKTADLYMASALYLQGIELLGLEPAPNNHRQKVFSFRETPELRRVVARFASNTLTVNLRGYLNSWRELRRQLDY